MRMRCFAVVAALSLTCSAPAGAEQPASGEAQRAWVDPVTGELGAPPADALDAGEAELGGAASAPLVVEPAPTSAGGIMIDLRGRPLYAFEATLAPDGSVVERCRRDD